MLFAFTSLASLWKRWHARFLHIPTMYKTKCFVSLHSSCTCVLLYSQILASIKFGARPSTLLTTLFCNSGCTFISFFSFRKPVTRFKFSGPVRYSSISSNLRLFGIDWMNYTGTLICAIFASFATSLSFIALNLANSVMIPPEKCLVWSRVMQNFCLGGFCDSFECIVFICI